MSSRQRAWQQEQIALGRCQVCGQAAAEGIVGYCQRHYDARQERARARRLAENELVQVQTCGFCGETGHNRRTCPERKAEEAGADVP